MTLEVPDEFHEHLGEKISGCVKSIPVEVLLLTPIALQGRAEPTWVERAIRVAFWTEYDRAVRTKTKIMPSAIWQGICSGQHFYRLIENPLKLAWIIQPVTEYKRSMETLLAKAIERVDEILHLPLYNDKGRPDAKIAAVVLAAAKQVEDRVKGMAVQRIHEKSERTLISDVPMNLNELDSKIKILEAELGREKAGLPEGAGTEESPDGWIAPPVRNAVV